MKDLKLGKFLRWGLYTLFGTFSIIGFIAICLGYYLHIITALGCITMASTIKKHW